MTPTDEIILWDRYQIALYLRIPTDCVNAWLLGHGIPVAERITARRQRRPKNLYRPDDIRAAWDRDRELK